MIRFRGHRCLQSGSRGVSLIEALVALAVMAFGMLGVVAMQSSMRQNSDIAKQRSEATRLAHQAIESRRTFTVMTNTAGRLAWADLIDQAPQTIVGTNASYVRTVTIPDLGGGRSKNLIVDVQWVDRNGASQSVRLASSITGSLPELAVAVGIPAWGGTLTRQPRGRDAAIPPAAVDQGDGTSTFTPPGASVFWVFNNATGFIEKSCTSPTTCTAVYLRLLAGFVNYATGPAQPLPADAETPTSAAFALDVAVDATDPVPLTVACFKDLQPHYVAYFCAVPVDPLAGSKWSGRSYLTGGTLSVATSAADASASRHRVCRYTPVRGCHPAVGSVIWGAAGSTASCTGASPTPNRKMSNAEHPLDYLDLTQSLANQNFLVIPAGDGTTAFTCPADDTATPLLQGNTWDHQPSS